LENLVASQAEIACLRAEVAVNTNQLQATGVFQHSFITWEQLQRRIRDMEGWLQAVIVALQRLSPKPKTLNFNPKP
jgi:hypothetical protein